MASLQEYFSVQVFFIVLRETIELAIIISVLLAFLQQSFGSKKASPQNASSPEAADLNHDHVLRQKELSRLTLHVWAGGVCGFIICLCVGAVILTVFYVIGNDIWALTEHYWEGVFSVLASVIISVMGVKILRVTKMQEKWRFKLGHLVQKYADSKNAAWSERNAMFILPFVTTLREGLEAIVFVGGIGINENTSVWLILNATFLAMVIGALVGVVLYRSGNTLSLQVFLLTSTCFLYLVAAGLFSKGIWNFELQSFIDKCDGFDVSETGHGPGSYDIGRSVWHVNCCSGEISDDGLGWMLFTAVFGWTNSATYGSVIGYNVYWIVVIAVFMALTYEEKNGELPVIPRSWQRKRIQKRTFMRLPRESGPRDSVDSTTPLKSQARGLDVVARANES